MAVADSAPVSSLLTIRSIASRVSAASASSRSSRPNSASSTTIGAADAASFDGELEGAIDDGFDDVMGDVESCTSLSVGHGAESVGSRRHDRLVAHPVAVGR